MTIDLISAILLVLAIFKGYRQGVIVAAFSFVALIMGVAAAMKLSVAVAHYLAARDFNSKWLSFLSFLLVLIAVIVIVKLVARLIQKLAEAVLMGWLNRICGILLFVFLYFTVYSVILFYAQKMGLTGPDTLEKSVTYPYIKRLGPWVIDHLGQIIPWFKDMFSALSDFFGQMATRLPA